jgi:hypothetical protein
MRKRGLLVGVFALCGLAWWLYLEAAGRPDARRTAEAAPSASARAAAAELPTPDLPHVPEPESARVEQEPGEPEPSAARFEELGPDEALLQVRVLALGSGQPLAGAKLRLETPAGASLARAHRPAARGTPAESLESDAQGRADFRVRAGEPYVLHTQFELPPGRSARLEVRPVEPGQYRTVVAHVFATTERTWYARVLDGVDGRPVPDARAALLRGSAKALAVPIAGDGGVSLALPAGGGSLRVWAPGYAEVETVTEEGHSGAEVAQRIELLRLAGLHVRAVDAGGSALEGCVVQTNVFDDESPFVVRRDESSDGRGVTDAEGRCLLEGLPPREGFTLTVLHAGRKRLARLDDGLAPGEVRELLLAFGDGCTLGGRVVDQHGVVLGGIPLCLVPGGGVGFLEQDRPGDQGLRTNSDEQGRFVFEDVAPGDWRLGPTSGQSVRLGREFRFIDLSEDESPVPVAPFAREVFVPEGVPSLEVELAVWRGLYIRGRVVGPEPTQWPEIVFATSGELEASALSVEGAFELGPLVPGDYELTVVTRSGWRSRPLRVAAGTSGVELVLEPGER